MTNEQTINNWLAKEVEDTRSNLPQTYEQLPSLKLTPNVVTEILVDFSKPFQKWKDEESKTIKAIIPVTVNGNKMNFWLNVKNPLYSELVKGGLASQSTFKVLQTGTQAQTRYVVVK